MSKANNMTSAKLILTAFAALLLGGCAALPEPTSKSAAFGQNVSPNRPIPRAMLRAPAKEFISAWDRDENGNHPKTSALLAAEAGRKSMARPAATASGTKAAGISATSWEFIGPSNVGGRIRSVLIDPRNPSRILIGAASGGIWQSTNGGASFSAVADFMGNLAIGHLVFDPTNPDILYAGTGESWTGLAGIGMFKSVNGGQTWNILPNTSTDATNPLANEWGATNRIAVDPFNPNIILAGTSRGTALNQGALMRSTDAGNTWTRVVLAAGTILTTNPPRVDDVKFDPNDSKNAVAAGVNAHVYYSRDGGATWAQTPPLVTTLQGRNGGARIELAYAKSKPDLLYASVDNGPSKTEARGELWRSEDGGVTWAMLSAPNHLNQQGDYDNTIWVSPVDSNHIVVGGLDLYQSTDGGVNFSRVSDWRFAGPGAAQPHADHHVIVEPPGYSSANPTLYIGNDGGLYRSSNILGATPVGTSTWQNLNNGLGITQFYGGAGLRAAGGRIIGGTQDNGALQLSQGTQWFRTAGGDGGFAAVDPADDSTFYGEYVYASVHRVAAGGSRQFICAGITEGLKDVGTTIYCGANATEATNFISPFILDPSNSNRMLVGANSLWVSNNVKAGVPSWSVIKDPVAPAAERLFINAVAVYERDANIVWTGHNTTGGVWKTTNALSATPTWTRMGQATLPGATVNRVTIDRDNPNRVWVALSGFAANRLWETADGGATWRSITGNLPAVTLHDIKRHPTQANWLYVGAANGVFTSENGGQSWSTVNDGPSSARVRELFWYDPTTLIAATYGRGMFKTTVAGGGAPAYTGLWWAGAGENGWGMSIRQYPDGRQFNAMYVYDDAGNPSWYAFPAQLIGNVATGDLYQPVSTPLNQYSPTQFNAAAAAGALPKPGRATLTFTGENTALLQYTINGISGQKNIVRQDVGQAGAAPLQIGDMWWGGQAENGWGVFLDQKDANVFGAWYTYGPNGQGSWYVMSAGKWTGNRFQGALYSVKAGRWLGAAFVPITSANVTEVGTLTLDFTSAAAATMTYDFTAGPFAGTRQTKPIVRQ